MCQRPKRAYFISTYHRDNPFEYKEGCVNALNGLTSFLPEAAILRFSKLRVSTP